jgi:hypothetical protein
VVIVGKAETKGLCIDGETSPLQSKRALPIGSWGSLARDRDRGAKGAAKSENAMLVVSAPGQKRCSGRWFDHWDISLGSLLILNSSYGVGNQLADRKTNPTPHRHRDVLQTESGDGCRPGFTI